jgi:hypothetical protein
VESALKIGLTIQTCGLREGPCPSPIGMIRWAWNFSVKQLTSIACFIKNKKVGGAFTQAPI